MHGLALGPVGWGDRVSATWEAAEQEYERGGCHSAAFYAAAMLWLATLHHECDAADLLEQIAAEQAYGDSFGRALATLMFG